jgi:uncharacterized Rmd1/YagE family protein
MELQHTRAQKRMHQHLEAVNKVNNAANNSIMKKVIFWIIIMLAFICVISAGLLLVNFAMNARV